jgi:hypothetical protein
LERDELLALWQDGVPLSIAWLVFADEWSAARFYQLKRIDSRLELVELERRLKVDHLGHLLAGKLETLGNQEGSDAGLVQIAQYYYSKTVETDWEQDKVATAGKIFHGVRVRWQRKGQPPKPTQWMIHPRELEALFELGPQALLELEPPTEPGMLIDPPEEWEWEQLDEAPPPEPRSSEPNELTVRSEREVPRDRPLSEPTPPQARPRGRPQVIPIVREVIRELIDIKAFVGLNKIEVERHVRRKAKERFPTLFPKPTQPSPNTISRGLKKEGWPSSW